MHLGGYVSIIIIIIILILLIIIIIYLHGVYYLTYLKCDVRKINMQIS